MNFVENKTVDSRRSWCILSIVFFSLFGAGGLQMSFGTILGALVDEFGESTSKIVWIGSLVTLFNCILSPLTIFLAQRHGMRITQLIGGIILTLGILATSVVNSVNLMFLTYGTLVGIGSALVYSPAFAAIPEYFTKYVSIATGIGSSGMTLGLIFFSFTLPILLPEIGWRKTLWGVAAIGPLISVCGLAFSTPKAEPTSDVSPEKAAQGANTDKESWKGLLKKKSFILWCIACFIFASVEYVPLFLVAQCAKDSGIPATETKWLNIVFGFGCFVGKVVSGSLAAPLLRRDMCKHLYTITIFAYSLSSFLVSLHPAYESLIAYMVFVGFLQGLVESLFFLVNLEIAGMNAYRTACGFTLALTSVSMTTGPPLAGLLYEAFSHIRYLLLAISATSFVASLFISVIPCATPRRSYTLNHGFLENPDYWRVYCHNVSPQPPRRPAAFVIANEAAVVADVSGHRVNSKTTASHLPKTISKAELIQVV
ncbi:monocarboxylate transporter 10-like [Dendronephthya gigantea]|uniref:monocarboxylate transporter 10-like n=1 Tax=Dendronephthya gigantea TaxID=151771 RepID=UPI00106D112A|nr:monocarboxylate transporter 10-like [Dendronephthya gigantea]